MKQSCGGRKNSNVFCWEKLKNQLIFSCELKKTVFDFFSTKNITIFFCFHGSTLYKILKAMMATTAEGNNGKQAVTNDNSNSIIDDETYKEIIASFASTRTRPAPAKNNNITYIPILLATTITNSHQHTNGRKWRKWELWWNNNQCGWWICLHQC